MRKKKKQWSHLIFTLQPIVLYTITINTTCGFNVVVDSGQHLKPPGGVNAVDDQWTLQHLPFHSPITPLDHVYVVIASYVLC